MFHSPPFIARRSTSVLPLLSFPFLSARFVSEAPATRPWRDLPRSRSPARPVEIFRPPPLIDRLPSSLGVRPSSSPSLVSLSSPSDSYQWRPRCALGMICARRHQRWQCLRCAPSARPGGRGPSSRRGRRRRPSAPRPEIGPAAPYHHLSYFYERATTPVSHSCARWTLSSARGSGREGERSASEGRR